MLVILIFLLFSFTGCLNQRVITSSQTSERLPKFISSIEDTVNSYDIVSDYETNYSADDNVSIDFSAYENFNNYNINLNICNSGQNERFILSLNCAVSEDEALNIDNDTLTLISNIISLLTDKEISTQISEYLQQQSSIVEEKDYFNKPMNNTNIYKHYEIIDNLEVYCSLSPYLNSYNEYISIKGSTKDIV